MSGFNSIALSGLKSSSDALTGVANNIANSETVGFKKKTSAFSNLVGGNSFGAGTTISSVKSDFSQGGRQSTGRVLDMMVDGSGFFMVSPESSQQAMYTRNGSFTLDAQGSLVDNQGNRVQGFQKNAAGQYPLNPSDIFIPQSYNAPEVTSDAVVDINLKAGGANFSTSVSVFDSLGKENRMDIDFVPTGVNMWDVNYTVDGNTYGPMPVAFDGAGSVIGAPVHTINIPGFSNGANASSIDVDLTSMTQFDGSNKINDLSSNGFGIGTLEGMEVTSDGIIAARYSNGQTLQDFRVAVVSFPNVDGLRDVGYGNFVSSGDTGARSLGFAGDDGFGGIVSNALESSNVDLTTELVDLITFQKSYRANSKVISTANQLTETTLNLDR